MKKYIKISPILLLIVVIIWLFNTYALKNANGSFSEYNKESCIQCHSSMEGFTSQHKDLSCVACHLGNADWDVRDDKIAAHESMISIPGNLSNASQTCSSTACHPGIDQRIEHSMMNTLSGIISIDKYTFGENDNLDSIFNVHHLGFSEADHHLRNKCASCHIGNEKTNLSPITELSRGGGCLACHLNYSEIAKTHLDEYIDLDILPKVHPSISLKVSDDHCFGCHSRSGRISTNYQGWHETTLKDISMLDKSKYRLLEDHRIFEKKTADIHHTLGLSCIDCHDTQDVMGDGQIHAHKEDAVSTKCKDCHTNNTPQSIAFSQMEDASRRMIINRGFDTTNTYVLSDSKYKELSNVYMNGKSLNMLGKNNGKEYQLSVPAAVCTNTHNNVSCSTCHTAWAPQCVSCHTEFDSKQTGYDLLAKKITMGIWNEYGDHYLADYPSLGVISNDGKIEYKTFTPGMVMSLKKDSTLPSFMRLFAPTSAHTIQAKGQACTSCHNNPVALGYGRGKLEYDMAGHWSFHPQFDLSQDGLPMDAWIGFLRTDTIGNSTRSNTRPLSFEEQKMMLRVGACLTCHKENSNVAKSMLDDFESTLSKVSKDCILPDIKEIINDSK